MNRTSNGRGWAYAGTALGGLVSIAANAAHSFVPPTGAPTAWRPPTGAIAFAVFWPIALFFALEILARVAWPAGTRWVVVRYLGLGPVAVVAAIVSYNHLSGLLLHYGESHLTARLGPLAVDGLMVMAASALMATSPQRTGAASLDVSETVLDQTSEMPPEQPKEHVPRPRKKAASKNARKRTPPKRSEEQLLAEAQALNADALANTGKPVPVRRLMSELRIGHPAATKLLDALTVTAPENAVPAAPEYAVDHANGEPVAAV